MNKGKILLFALASIAAVSCVHDDVNMSSESAEVAIAKKIINTSDDATKGELIIYVDDQTALQLEGAADATRSGVMALDQVVAELGATELKPVFNMLVNAEQKRELNMHRWYSVSFSEDIDVEYAAKTLAEVGAVKRVQYATRVVVPKTNFVPANIDAVAQTRTENLPFNDPQLVGQWHYNNDGTVNFPNAKAGADINLFSAWKHTAGRPEVIVAVVDEGVCYTHEDLKDSFLVNEAELNGEEGVDDDENGYKDDIYGYNFVDNGRVTWTRTGDQGHGTHVAGTVAAVNNNGIGVCGVAGGTGKGDGVRIISCQIMSGSTAAGPSATAAAIEYAADRGACVLQNSWGFGAGQIANDSFFENGDTSVEVVAFKYFMEKKNCEALDGGIVIFASGNDGKNVAGYPAAWNKLISVSAVGPDGLPTYYTNYNLGCNVSAPGGEYGTAWATPGCVLSTIPTDKDGNKYAYAQGTSMACPHVSGIAALAISYALDNGIKLTLPELKDIIVSSVRNITDFYGTMSFKPKYAEGGSINLASYKNKMGTGLIDAERVLMAVRGTTCIPLPVGEQAIIDITNYIGDGKCQIKMLKSDISDEAIDALGITDYKFMGSKLVLTCTKPGSALVTLKYVAGGTVVGGGQITGGMEAQQEFVFIAREGVIVDSGTGSPYNPGGWL